MRMAHPLPTPSRLQPFLSGRCLSVALHALVAIMALAAPTLLFKPGIPLVMHYNLIDLAALPGPAAPESCDPADGGEGNGAQAGAATAGANEIAVASAETVPGPAILVPQVADQAPPQTALDSCPTPTAEPETPWAKPIAARKIDAPAQPSKSKVEAKPVKTAQAAPSPIRKDAPPATAPQGVEPAGPVSAESATGASATGGSSTAAGTGQNTGTAHGAGQGQRSGTGAGGGGGGGPIPDVAPKRVRHIEPKYPELARERGLSGVVKVRFTVDVDGNVKNLTLVAADHPDFFAAPALEAAALWRFEPAHKDGRPIEVSVLAPIRFQLKR